jgi:hypothetical protein
MTSQSPRIYIYKITFEEVPYYYYGVKKEKYFNQEYWGSPITHKWCWDFYTPKKQILELFNYTDEGYIQAQEIEKRIIALVLNDKWCLNENVGGKMSINIRIQAGKKAGQKTYELGLGLHSLSIEEKKEVGKRGGTRTKELGVGAFAISPEQRKEINKKSNETSRKNKTGLYSRTKEEQIESGKNWGKKGSKKTNLQKWMCLETGYITTSGPLTSYQKARSIDTSKRVRVS